ncbi:MAG: cupin domain-containing protein [Lentisphaerae bacterium]|nr:cupin domain-containing protein [Lentisphaerota bacterium]
METDANLKGKAISLKDCVDYARAAVVSKTLIDKPAGTLTLFAFDAGQGLSEHTAPYDAVVQILDGEAELTIGGRSIRAREGDLVIMPAGVPHALCAGQRFKMLLTMIRSSG